MYSCSAQAQPRIFCPGLHPQEDLAHQFQHVLYVGRFLGLIPVTGVHKGEAEGLKFQRWTTFAPLLSTFITFCLGFSTLIAVIGFFRTNSQNASELTWSAHLFVFYGTGFFIYAYFLKYSQYFIDLFKEWKDTRLHYPLHDSHLRRDANLIAFTLLASIALENTTWHWRHFVNDGSVSSSWSAQAHCGQCGCGAGNESPSKIKDPEDHFEAFYYRSEPEWASVLSYNPIVALFVFITSKWALFSWNFYDVLLIIMSRAFYMKFKLLNEVASKTLFEYGYASDVRKWKALIEDHITIARLLSSFASFLSPIVFLSYAANIYDVSIHMSLGLSVWNNSMIGSIYSVWAFCHLATRFFLVSWTAAQINEHARGILKILKQCPIQLYTTEVKAFERRLCTTKIGLHGLHCFTITKSFMLRMLGVLFTIEIVLLQCSRPGSCRN